MQPPLQIQVTLAEDGNVFNITETDIVRVVADTLGSKIMLWKDGADLQEYIVTETPAQLVLLSKALVSITHTDDSAAEWINANRILLVDDEGTGAVIKYNVNGAHPRYFTVNETPGNINEQIAVLAGATVYTIDTVNKTTKSFTLIAGDGDVTAIFAAGKVFSVIDSTGNDGTYTVDSSSHGGGRTTIVVTQTVSSSADDGTILIVV